MNLTWANMIIFWAAGQDWLGTQDQLAEPTYVGFFGYLGVGTKYWVPIFAVLVALLGLLSLVVLPGLVQLLGKLWAEPGPSSSPHPRHDCHTESPAHPTLGGCPRDLGRKQ
jgi:hypothetical protein